MTTSTTSLLTVSDVATWLQLKRQTIERWARAGTLPAIRLQGRYRFRRSDVEAWLRARRTAR